MARVAKVNAVPKSVTENWTADPPKIVTRVKSLVKRKYGMFWHVHHGKTLEWCTSFDERVDYIAYGKPKYERDMRYRLMRPATGIPRELLDAARKNAMLNVKITRVNMRVQAVRDAGNGKNWDETEKKLAPIYKQRMALHDEHILTVEVLHRAERKYASTIKKLHAEQCLDWCPIRLGDSTRTIFPKGWRKK